MEEGKGKKEVKEEGREGKEAGDKGGREEETEGVYNPIICNF